MNKRLLILILACVLLITSGCAAAGQKLDTAEDRIEEKLDAVEDSIEQSLRKAAASAAPEASAAADPVTKEKAEEIALKYLELTKDQVKRLHTDYEIDAGIGQYEVRFISGDWEYEFEIHAETGKILSFDKDHILD